MITAFFFCVLRQSCTKHLHFASFAQFATEFCQITQCCPALWYSFQHVDKLKTFTKFKMISTKNSSSHNNDRLDCMLLGRKACYHNLYPLVAFFGDLLKVDFFYLFPNL